MSISRVPERAPAHRLHHATGGSVRLVRQAGNIAQRVLKEIIYANEK
ncbi:MAG: hypothetical protein IK000_09125 [Bacteroidaceae bacterium]|nr:hypothetical protein [Bacteroidaceae bacterium]